MNSGVNVELVLVVKFSRYGLERQLEVVERQLEVLERHSCPFRPNLTTECAIILHCIYITLLSTIYRPNQLTWAVNPRPPVGSGCRPYIHHRYLLLLSPKADSFYRPTEGRRLSPNAS